MLLYILASLIACGLLCRQVQQCADMQGHMMMMQLSSHHNNMRFRCTKEPAAEKMTRLKDARLMLTVLEHTFNQVQS